MRTACGRCIADTTTPYEIAESAACGQLRPTRLINLYRLVSIPVARAFYSQANEIFLAGFPACLFRQTYNRESSTEGFHLVEATQDSERLGSGVWQDGLARTDFRCPYNLNLPEATTISVQAIVWSFRVNLNHLIERFLRILVTENERRKSSHDRLIAPLDRGAESARTFTKLNSTTPSRTIFDPSTP